MRNHKWVLIVATALLLSSATVLAGERGFFGFGLKVDGKGFFMNPTIQSITIGSITPDSPVARSPMAVGDAIVKVEGVPVAGKKAKELQAMAERQVGQTLRLDMKRPNGEAYAVALVAVRRPKGI